MKTLLRKLQKKEKRVARLEKEALAAQARSKRIYDEWTKESAKLAILRASARSIRLDVERAA